MRDFNAVSGQQEKWGGQPFASSSSDGFAQLIMDNGLINLGSLGPRFTWSNGRSGFHQIRERLDKGLLMGLGRRCSLGLKFVSFLESLLITPQFFWTQVER